MKIKSLRLKEKYFKSDKACEKSCMQVLAHLLLMQEVSNLISESDPLLT